MEATAESPCHQFFIGLPSFSVKCPFTYSTPALFRRRTTAEMPMAANESFLKDSPSTPEHRDAQPGWGKAAPAPEAGADGVAGTLVLDAACPPVDIRFPQDFSLLDEAREKTDGIIDVLHRQVAEKGERHPRTCREALRKAHLGMAKARRRPANKMRALVRRLLLALARNPGFIEALLARGGRPTGRQARMLDAIGGLRRRQKEMSDGHRHRVGGRMVGISQPHVRPMVRGKAKSPVEFGPKHDVSIDEKGHARLGKASSGPCNECGVFKDAVERHRARTGHCPARALADRIYRTRENRGFRKEHGITMCGRGPGLPARQGRESRRSEARDEADRIEVERFFSREKRTCGAALLVTRLAETTLASLALSVFVANLFGIPATGFFVLYFLELPEGPGKWHLIEFSDTMG